MNRTLGSSAAGPHIAGEWLAGPQKLLVTSRSSASWPHNTPGSPCFLDTVEEGASWPGRSLFVFHGGKALFSCLALCCHSIWKYQEVPAKPQQRRKGDRHKGERPQGMEIPTRGRTPMAQQQKFPNSSGEKWARAPTGMSPKTAVAPKHRRPSTFRNPKENANRTQDERPSHTHQDG